MDLEEVIAHHWGINNLRPLQEPAMKAVIEGRDSVVVLPTGGGKSLCYQAPAVYLGKTTVVISPLISLMKDQVDGLKSCGINAIQLDSSQNAEARRKVMADISDGKINLLFVSPERMANFEFREMLREMDIRTFAIDEAHCISHWGHDFRPEYRQLGSLKEMFPRASVHAYTATATERVRADIVQQLGLGNAEILVGNFDRPNLTYRVHPRREILKQILSVIERNKGEGGIVYCLRRADVDELNKKLKAQGVNSMPYHAGLTPIQRGKAQDAFVEERCDVIVATVAFGMGIDRSNVRYVIHAALPKSLEHYQQETGRAGRDGLEAECTLFYSGADFFAVKGLIEKPNQDGEVDREHVAAAMEHLREMDRYCKSAACRHGILLKYFGQTPELENCNACDLCLGETQTLDGAETIAKKILSCVLRVNQRFGIKHVVSVLRGMTNESIVRCGHERLSTYGILKEHKEDDLRDWIYQLIGQDVLAQEEVQGSNGQVYPILKLTVQSREVLTDARGVRLLQPVERKKGQAGRKSKAELKSWDGVDSDLFEILRGLRREIAQAKRVPPYVVFNDATLREFSKVKPATLTQMRSISGVGDAKLRDFGPQFLEAITQFN